MRKNKLRMMIFIIPVVIFIVSLFVGRYPISIENMVEIIKQAINPLSTEKLEPYYSIVWNIRMPRAIAASLVGAALAISGVAFQSIFSNPLVNSGTLGVSAGAGFGAALAIILFNNSSVYIYLFAFSFGLLSVALSYLIGRMYGSSFTMMVILGGVIVSSIFSSLTSFLKYVADPYNQLPAITFWLMGSFASIDYNKLLFSAIPIIVGGVGIILIRWRINVLTLPDKEAHSLGINLKFEKSLVIFLATLTTAGAVCLSGTIGWVGLIVPHISRRLVGTDNKVLVPVSAALGAAFLLIIDNVARVLTGGEIPIGILTSIIGGPFFIYILKKTKGETW